MGQDYGKPSQLAAAIENAYIFDSRDNSKKISTEINELLF
jgi:hypothetical protein